MSYPYTYELSSNTNCQSTRIKANGKCLKKKQIINYSINFIILKQFK